MYADTMTNSMKKAIDETNRRRKKQLLFNKENNITPRSIEKAIRESIEVSKKAKDITLDVAGQTEDEYEVDSVVAELQRDMELYARNLQFERAAEIRDKIREIKK